MVETTGLDLHFRPGMGENDGSDQFLNWSQQMSTGHLHLNRFVSLPYQIKRTPGWVSFLFGGDYGTRTCDLMRVKHAL